MAEKKLGSMVDSLLNGLETIATTKTVVGEPIYVNDTILLPLIDVSIGVGAGAAVNGSKSKEQEGGGMGAKLSPTAILVIKEGSTRLISVKDQSIMGKALDMVPDLVNRFTGKSTISDPEVKTTIEDIKNS